MALINPSQITTEYVVINSIDRSTVGSESMEKMRVQLAETQRIEQIELISFTSPPTYNVRGSTSSNQNNQLTFDEGGADLTATVAAGAHSSSSLATALKTALDAASTLPQTYTVTFSSTTFKYTISAAGAFTLQFSLNASLARMLGFAAEDTASATSHTGTNMADLTDGVRHLFITIDGIHSPVNSTNTTIPRAAFVVPLVTDTSTGAFNFHLSETNYKQCMSAHSAKVNAIYVALHQDNGKAPEFNGVNWSMVLRIQKRHT